VYQFLAGAWTIKMGLSARPMAPGAVALEVADGDPAGGAGVVACVHEAMASARANTRARYLKVR
jgi:hypothetical protein